MIVMSMFLTSTSMVPFTVGALGMATLIGLGDGAVFKLVPEYFPASVGSVTGLVGAAGGLGGFFPPLVLGFLKQQMGTFTLGFAFLGFTSLACLLLVRRHLLALCLAPPPPGTQSQLCSRARFCSYAEICVGARPQHS